MPTDSAGVRKCWSEPPPGPLKLRHAVRLAFGESNIYLLAARNRGCKGRYARPPTPSSRNRRSRVDAATPAAIDQGVKAADEGRTVSLEEARNMIPQWISKFESQTRR
jgi:hypothetical protein